MYLYFFGVIIQRYPYASVHFSQIIAPWHPDPLAGAKNCSENSHVSERPAPFAVLGKLSRLS